MNKNYWLQEGQTRYPDPPIKYDHFASSRVKQKHTELLVF